MKLWEFKRTLYRYQGWDGVWFVGMVHRSVLRILGLPFTGLVTEERMELRLEQGEEDDEHS